MPNIATVQVFDFETLTGDPTATFPAAAVGALIEATLTFNQVNSVSPASNLQAMKVSTVTDTTGRWQLNLIPNGNINPSGTLWTIKTPTQSYQISVPNSGPVQSSTIKVNAPVSFGPVSSTSGALTVQGLLTAQAGLTVAGAVNLPAGSVPVGDLSGVLPVANGGTGSGTQNFVDLSTAQTVGGTKTFSGGVVSNGGTTLRPAAANQVGLLIQGQPSQSGDYLEIMTNGAVILAKVDSTGALTFGGHMLAASAQPTLGALQTNIASQSIAGNDVRGVVTVATGATGPGINSPIAVVNFANAFGVTPIVMITDQGSTAQMGSFCAGFVSTTSFSIYNSGGGATLAPSTTYKIGYVVVG